MVSFIKAQPNIVQKILTHISSSPISDLLLKLISIEDIPEGAGIVEWLYTENLIPSLVQRLNPQLDPEVRLKLAVVVVELVVEDRLAGIGLPWLVLVLIVTNIKISACFPNCMVRLTMSLLRLFWILSP